MINIFCWSFSNDVILTFSLWKCHNFPFYVIYLDDYLHHTSCIMEAEKYEKTSNKQKPPKKNPQDKWNKMIEKSISSAPESFRSMFT